MTDPVKKNKIIFFGSFDFALETMRELLTLPNFQIVAVVTNPDTFSGRENKIVVSPIKSLALSKGLKIFQPQKLKNDLEFLNNFRQLEPDLGIVVGYGKILPAEILAIPRCGFLNLHPSLLPKYRGPTPVPAAILNGETKTGITIIKIDEQVDHGPILAQEELLIKPEDTVTTLYQKLFQLATKLLVESLPDYFSGKLQPKPQDDSRASYSKMFTAEDAKLTIGDSVELAMRKIRAYNPEPGAYLVTSDWPLIAGNKFIRLKILEAERVGQFDQQQPVLKFKDGYLLLKQVQPEGKRVMSGEAFFRGHRGMQRQNIN